MAQIKIQEKKGRAWWPWLLLLIPLAWVLMRSRNDGGVADRDAAADSAAVVANATGTGTGATVTDGGTVGLNAGGATAAAGAGAANANAMNDYSTFIGTPATGTRDDAGQHEYTANGLRRLAAAIEGSRVGATSATQVGTIRSLADSLQQTPATSDRHADMARRAMDASLAPLGQLASGSSSTLESAAKAVRPDRKLLAQKDQVQRFFEAARDALQAAGASPTPNP